MRTNDNPYDTLFRAVFGEAGTAKELTLLLLPGEYAARLSGAAVTVEPESLVDPRERTRWTDLLLRFEPPGGKEATYVYVLYEHKSTPDRWVSLQLLRYMAVLWQQLAAGAEAAETDEPSVHSPPLLPEIVPVVLYHGERSWTYPLQFASLVAGGGASAHTPHFEPHMVNLGDIPDEQVTGSLRAVLGLFALKHVRLRLVERTAELLVELLHRAEAEPALRPLVELIERVYVGTKSRTDVRRLVAAASRLRYHEVEGGMMTYAEELLKEGREQGLEQGLLRGREQGLERGSLQRSRDILVRQLDRRFGLSDVERARIMGCEDAQALDAALDAFALAESKTEVLACLP